ncbi:hypothetical protein [Streptomyces roseoverticillatus]|uniref:Uncharacterized protein n=1 Tax=Streptomyces roseoverticillatus TaxID=66429 RepID=A0ABV3J6X7_9ACTN
MTRYSITKSPDGVRWVILDTALWGYCAMPDGTDGANLLPLEWKTRPAAEAWLNLCYRLWAAWEDRPKVGGQRLGPPPRNWRPRPESSAPWPPFVPPSSADAGWPPPGMARRYIPPKRWEI